MENEEKENENKFGPGVYIGTPCDYGLTENSEGKPSPFITFLLEAGRTFTWYGSLKEGKAREHTVKHLLVCGFNGTDLTAMADGPEAGVINMENKVKLDIQENVYNGKTSLRINWINELSGVKNKLDKAGAVAKMQGFDIAGELLKQRQERGISNEATPKTENFTTDDIPF